MLEVMRCQIRSSFRLLGCFRLLVLGLVAVLFLYLVNSTLIQFLYYVEISLHKKQVSGESA